MVLEIGRVCVKTAGREAGKRCVVVDVLNSTFVLVSGPEVKRRRCNVKHLEPTPHKLNLSKGASDEEIKRAFEEAKLA